jgi:hypothetical protein
MTRRKYKIIAAVALLIVGVPLALMAVQISFTLYDGYRVESVCAKLVPGTSIPNIRRIAAAAGLERFIPPMPGVPGLGSYDETEKNWFFSIPVVAEMGDRRCAVYHDGHVILKAGMELL